MFTCDNKLQIHKLVYLGGVVILFTLQDNMQWTDCDKDMLRSVVVHCMYVIQTFVHENCSHNESDQYPRTKVIFMN